MSNYYYLDVSLEFLAENHQVSAVLFKKHVVESLQTLFGSISSAIQIDILKYNKEHIRAIIRVPEKFYVKLRSALTLSGSYDNIRCAYTIHSSSPCLLSILGDSRSYEH